MLRRIGTSVLLGFICLTAFAQLPHPNDTLENGKKVPFNQFLGRFSVFNEFGGAGRYYSFNIGYSIIKTDLITTDLTIGANHLQFGQYRWKEEVSQTFALPIGLNALIGRRRSRFNLKAGYCPVVGYTWTHESYDPNRSYREQFPEHRFYFSLGYTYQSPRGFFFGINAYYLMVVDFNGRNFEATRSNWYGMPWAGTSLGYRLPSKQQHREWTERGFKRRILRLEETKEKREKEYDEIDNVFYNDAPLKVDSLEIIELQAQLIKLKKRHERYLKEEQRLNGRSLVFAEFFGAAGIWSVNYSYTHPIAKSNTWMMEYRGGIGTDDSHLQLPLHVGVKAMKNYRGTGIFVGIVPQYNWHQGTFGAVYFLEHNVEFHFHYGFTGGVAFYLSYDPAQYKYYQQFAPYAGFFFGYRLPQLKH